MNKWLYNKIIIVVKIRDFSRRDQILWDRVRGEAFVEEKILRNMEMLAWALELKLGNRNIGLWRARAEMLRSDYKKHTN